MLIGTSFSKLIQLFYHANLNQIVKTLKDTEKCDWEQEKDQKYKEIYYFIIDKVRVTKSNFPLTEANMALVDTLGCKVIVLLKDGQGGLQILGLLSNYKDNGSLTCFSSTVTVAVMFSVRQSDCHQGRWSDLPWLRVQAARCCQ